MIRVNVWSGPRNVSTALMYSFRQHPSVTVVDEPFYGHWLRVTGTDHPGRNETMAAMELDGEVVVQSLLSEEWPSPVLVCKQMAHHLVDVSHDWIDACTNVLLLRHPREVLLSYAKGVENPDLDMLGYPNLVMLLERELAADRAPVVIDSVDLLTDPPGVLARMCSAAGFGFHEAMLSWPAGPKPEDGVWAPHWYAGVHGSTGFASPTPRPGDVPTRLQHVLDAALPLYGRLRKYC